MRDRTANENSMPPAGMRAGRYGARFMASDTLLASNKFGAPLPFAALWILSTYWWAQWCIAGAMGDKARDATGDETKAD